MAPKSRSQRTTRLPKRRAPKKRASRVTAAKARKRAAVPAVPGIVEAALAAFAHEVRTPLTGILAISGLLATSDLDERERRWVDTIKAGAEHLASLATLFVDAAKGGNAAAGVRQDFFDLRVLARNAGDSLAGRAAAKGLQSQIDISARLPALVIGDPVRLRAALENLIDNAVKFTERGGVALAVEPMLGQRGKVAVSNADAGVASDAVQGLRVLSVEDNPFGRVVLNTILTELGHQAEFIGQGEAATERIAQGDFNAVLMDMVLPGIDGIEAIKRIRSLSPPLGRIPIIGVSGRGDDEAASRAAGADAFLLKPVSPRALATALLEATRHAAAAT